MVCSRLAPPTAALALLTTLFAAGCTPDFEEPFEVLDLRILALRADPPEVFIDEQTTTPPPVWIDALVVDPVAPTALVDWQLWACTPEADHCGDAEAQWLLTVEQTRQDAIRHELVPTVAMLEAALAADPLKGFNGLPLMVELRVERAGQLARAVKRVVYNAPFPVPFPPGKTPNQNPTIALLRVDGEPWQGPIEATPGEPLSLRPEAPDASREEYVVPTFTGEMRTFTEFLTYSFFTTTGEFSFPVTGGKPSEFATLKRTLDSATEWTPDAEAQGTAYVWIVVRDDRGGAGWVTLPITLR